jgi:hypothetical protein
MPGPPPKGESSGVVHVMSPATQIVHSESDNASFGSLADERDAERAEVLGEDRDDVDPHLASR